MTAIMDSIRKIFGTLICHFTEGLAPSHQILYSGRESGKVYNDQVNARLHRKMVMTAVMKVLQSNDHIELDAVFQWTSLHCVGASLQKCVGAKGQKIMNKHLNFLKKHYVISIPMGADGLCRAKVVVFAMSHLEKTEQQLMQ